MNNFDKFGKESAEKGSVEDKLANLKVMVEKADRYKDYLPEGSTERAKEAIEMAEKVLQAKKVLEEVVEFLDIDFDIKENVKHVREVLQVLKKSAEWLRHSTAGEFVTRGAAEVVELIVEFDAMAERLEKIGIESKEGAEIAEEMKVILDKIIVRLEQAIEVIDMLKLIDEMGDDIGFDDLKRLMEEFEK